MHMLDILEAKLRKLSSADVLPDVIAGVGVIAAYVEGWKFAAVLSGGQYAEFCPSVALAVFVAAYVIAFSKYFSVDKNFYLKPTAHKLLMYRVLPVVQAFTAGIILHIYKLDTVANAWGDEIMLKMWTVVLGAIIISTWLIRYLAPAFGRALMPIFVFVAGTIASSAMLRSVGMENFINNNKYIAGSANHIFAMFGSTFPLGAVPMLLLYAAKAAIIAGLLYVFARTYMVYSRWSGHTIGSALNGFIASIIVVLPFFSGGRNALFGNNVVPSVMEGMTFAPATPYSYLVWSWMLANFVTMIPMLNRFRKMRPRKQYTMKRQVQNSAPAQIQPSQRSQQQEVPVPLPVASQVTEEKPEARVPQQAGNEMLPLEQKSDDAINNVPVPRVVESPSSEPSSPVIEDKENPVAKIGEAPLNKNRRGNKMAPPSDENKDLLLSSLHGQRDALDKLWRGAIYPVLSGQKKFSNAILLGPTGVGKTETAKKIADIFYAGRLLRFDMNQFGTEFEATRLFGAAPGYIGSDRGGKLPTGLKHKSPCVILFDEVEKAHPTILQTLLQFCGEGYAEDSKDQRFEANSSIIIMTSNIWPDRANELWQMSQDRLKIALKGYISNRFAQTGPVQLFSPEFLGRVNAVVPFKPFSKEIAAQIIAGMLEAAAKQYNVSIAEDSDMAIVDAIEINEGFRGLQNAFDEWVTSFLSNIKVIPVDSFLGIVKKGGKVYITLETLSGEVVAQEIKKMQKGYAIDVQKLTDWENSPLKSVLGQDAQIAEIVDHLKIAASGFVSSPQRPMGIFLLAGPTGVGKTETAKALANWLFDGRLIKKDMGEYQSPYDGARLFGDRGKMGDLTKEVQESGNCVVVLDEVEKANSKVLDTLLAPFDDGLMNDAAVNLKVSFKNTVIIMTTNLAPESNEDPSALATLPSDERRDLFAYHFKPELLGRVDKVLIYNELPGEVVALIIRKRIEKIVKRKKEDEGIAITIEEDVYERLTQNIQSSTYGIRGADEVISATLGRAVSEIYEAEAIHISLQDTKIVATPTSSQIVVV
jgi:ATP-dependent Clp protease ATP-binding subunit ClpA